VQCKLPGEEVASAPMSHDPDKPRRRGRKQAVRQEVTKRRERTVRLSQEVVARLTEGHPWVYRDALRGRQLSAPDGAPFDLVDSSGQFIARALHEPEGPIALRVFSRKQGARCDAEHVLQAVRRAARWRRGVLPSGPDDCMRLFSGDAEGVPALNAERYGPFIVLTSYSAVTDSMTDDVVRAFGEVWRPRGIYLRRRRQPSVPNRPKEPGALVFGEAAPSELVVTEGNIRFAVDVTAPVGTGLYVDMRNGRARLAGLAAGRRVLNCFSYTGAFSVVAAMHGAREVISVDVAARAHTRARRNCSLNAVESRGVALEFITGDTLATIARLAGKGRRFDLVVLDPPTFASGKGRGFAAAKDYVDLMAAAAEVTAPNGIVLAACNTAKLSWGEFERALGRGAWQANRAALLLERITQPPDFPTQPAFAEGRYLKIALLRLSDSAA
jgi:23S rRNA (cytosine1962-C5)-methyltransferase